MSYGLGHRRVAVRLLQSRLATDLHALEKVRAEIKQLRKEGQPTSKQVNKRRAIVRSVARTRHDIERLNDSIRKRQGWVDDYQTCDGDNRGTRSGGGNAGAEADGVESEQGAVVEGVD